MQIFKLIPVYKDYIWGGKTLSKLYGKDNGSNLAESWEFSVHSQGKTSLLGKDGEVTLEQLIKDNPKFLGRAKAISILIKLIDAADNLSVQVHPDDSFAKKYENSNGKTEMWYIISSAAGGGLYLGFNRQLDKAEFESLIESGDIESALNFVPVKGGDCFLVEAGTVHAIGKGVTLLEVQQNSDITYRIYDYKRKDKDGKPRQLHVEKAKQVADLNKYRPLKKRRFALNLKRRLLADCKYFKSYEIALDSKYFFKTKSKFAVLNIISGSGTANGMEFKGGDTFFCPANTKVELYGSAKIVLTYQKH